MEKQPNTVILTYYGVDGACAAALALLQFPHAEVRVTSARRVASSLQELAGGAFTEAHICGVGVYCEWGELESALAALSKQGAHVYWHCGRGYLDADRRRLEPLCTPVFCDAGTNAAGLARALGVADSPAARRLLELARRDPNLPGALPEAEAAAEDRFWLDLVQAAISQYFKFQDGTAYPRAVRKLSAFDADDHDRAMVETFRRTGYRYMLHGSTEAVCRLRERVQKCADADRHVVITGESGVGKEHVAHLIWERSPRATGPLVAVNCALYAGSAHLANSDLFGHQKGAFTGADRERAGKFLAADGGLLFLDEIGELPLEVQAKLLRVLEDGRVMPIGADQYVREVDVRVLAATNRDLPAMVREGTFREDLYHRLATLRIHVPPLRERREDILVIARQRLELLAEEGRPRRLTRADAAILTQYGWPGNVRQLIKILERAVLLDLPLRDVIEEERSLGELVWRGDESLGAPLLPERKEDVRPLRDVQREYARRAWELHGRNYAAAARALGINANTLRYTHLREDPA